MKKLTPGELADKLEAKPGLVRRVIGKALRPIVFAAALAAIAAHASPAQAAVGVNDGAGNITSLSNVDENGVISPVTDPDQAYGFAYGFGQDGVTMNGATGNPAIDAAITNGNIDGMEGLPASPPSGNPAPGSRGEIEVDPANPTNAYALGYELGLVTDINAYAVDLDAPTEAEVGAFDDGLGDAESGDGPSCAACGSCAGCAGCGGCGSCGGCGGCG